MFIFFINTWFDGGRVGCGGLWGGGCGRHLEGSKTGHGVNAGLCETVLKVGMVPGGRGGREIRVVFSETFLLGFFGGLVDCFCFGDEIVCLFGGIFAWFREETDYVFGSVS
jgi:hypothetical protein